MYLNPPPEDDKVRAIYQSEIASQGYIMNLERLWAWRPDLREAFTAARSLLGAQTSLTTRERAVIICATVRSLGDSYCSLAWGTRLADAVGAAPAAELLRTGTATALSPREQALAGWVAKVARNPNGSTSDDVDRLRQAGLSDQEIFDATLLAAFRIAFSTVNDALGAAPDLQLAREAPAEVRRAVDYGRPVAST